LLGFIVLILGISVSIWAGASSDTGNKFTNLLISLGIGLIGIIVSFFILKSLEWVVRSILVPGIFISLFLIGVSITYVAIQGSDADRKISAVAGFFAGLLVFVLAVLAHAQGILSVSLFPAIDASLWRNYLLYALPSIIFGFVFMRSIILLLPNRGAGFLVTLARCLGRLAIW
jgi:hypothetical protein